MLSDKELYKAAKVGREAQTKDWDEYCADPIHKHEPESGALLYEIRAVAKAAYIKGLRDAAKASEECRDLWGTGLNAGQYEQAAAIVAESIRALIPKQGETDD